MSSTVEKIKERLSVSDVISSYIKLEPNGINYKARCPFHNEKTPSFFVSTDRGGYYCFGCNKKGDMFTFVQEFEGVDFKGALKILAEQAGVPLVYDRGGDDPKERLFAVMEESAKFFEGNLTKNVVAMEYLKNRGLTSETIERFRLGFVPDEWRSLYEYLQGKKFSDSEIERAGLIKKKDQGGYYDRFRGRIIFPIADGSGRIVAFTGRIFGQEKEGEAKYLNSPETELFLKSKTLYGFDKAKFDIKKRDYAILVEGQMDLIMSHQAGFTNTVASSGTAITQEGLLILSRLSPNVMIAFDRDNAGILAARRAAAISALSLDMTVKIVAAPDGKDPADTILLSVDGWKDALRNAKDIVLFELETIVGKGTPSSKFVHEIEKYVFPYLRAMERGMRVDHYIRMISEKTGLPPEGIRNDFNSYLIKNPVTMVMGTPPQSSSIEKPRRTHMIERKLYGLILYLKDKPDRQLLSEELRSRFESIIERDVLKELEQMKDVEPIVIEAEEFLSEEHDTKRTIDELLLNLEEERLQEQFIQKSQELRRAEGEKDEGKIAELLSICHSLTIRINEIKKQRAT